MRKISIFDYGDLLNEKIKRINKAIPKTNVLKEKLIQLLNKVTKNEIQEITLIVKNRNGHKTTLQYKGKTEFENFLNVAILQENTKISEDNIFDGSQMKIGFNNE